jgi:hypothetical protein
MIFVTKQEYNKRLDICKSCEDFNHTLSRCKKCRCFMIFKCGLSEAECPVGKWSISNSIEKQDPSI